MFFSFLQASHSVFSLDTEHAQNSGHYHAFFQLVDPVSTTLVYKNAVLQLKTYKADVTALSGDNE